MLQGTFSQPDRAHEKAGTGTEGTGKQGELMGDANRQGMGEGGVATMTPQPQDQEYIITENQIEQIGQAMTRWYLPDAGISLCRLLRSRPHTSTPEPLQSCKYIAGALCVVCDDSICKFYPLHNHDTAIRNATLDDLYLNYKKRYVEDAIDEIRRSLRTQEHP